MKKVIIGISVFFAGTFILALIVTPNVNEGGGGIFSNIIRGMSENPSGTSSEDLVRKMSYTQEVVPISVMEVWINTMIIFGSLTFIFWVWSVFKKGFGGSRE